MFRRLICSFLLSLFPALHAEFPLRDLAVDQTILLSEWRFQVEPANAGPDWSTNEFAADRAVWPQVTVPGIWDKAPGKVKLPIPQQAGWYRSEIPIPELNEDEELALCFLGVKYTADVFVNGNYLGVHRGGYTPFLLSLPPMSPDQTHLEIVVRVDNRLSDRTVPKMEVGWELYGGIDREVYLLVQPKTRPEDLFVQTFQTAEGSWNLRLQGAVKGTPANPLNLRLLLDGSTVSETCIEDWSGGLDVTLPLDHPALWSPDHPVLHELELRWGQHQIRFPVGIRELKWVDGKLQMNGHSLWLQGFGQHEFYPKAGSILSTEQRREDLEDMKNFFAANALRTAHYPQHPELYALADEIGILIFSEIPVWQNDPESLIEPDVWDNWIEPQLNEMILRYRNHPCVFGWGVLNEISDAHPYIVKARDFILERDPSRGVAAVIASDRDFDINQLTDFAARNLHYGWYHSRSVYKLRQGVAENLENSNGLPIWVSELGGIAKPGRLGGGFSDDVRGTETYQDKLVRFGLQYIMSQAKVMAGISLWTWSDFEVDGHALNHGILSATRKPKLAAYTAMNLMRPPLVALGTERKAEVPAGRTFEAQLFVFARDPLPGKTVNLHWQIRSPQNVIREGNETCQLGDLRAQPVGEVSWAVPVDQSPSLLFLYLELQDDDGKRLHSQAIPFEAGGTTRPGVLRIPPHPDTGEHTAKLNGMTFTVYPFAGLLLPLPAGSYDLQLDGVSRSFIIQNAKTTDLPWEK